MVSVCMITYNQEEYITEAIEGVLMQETSFDYELIIGEDCGADDTYKICQEFADKFPDKVKLLPSEKNLGAMANLLRTLDACKGKYVAVCEGDDYWIDPNKLQLQVDFLDNNDEYTICAHNTLFKNREGQLVEVSQKKEQDFSLRDFIYTTRIGSNTCSIMFLNQIIEPKDLEVFKGSLGADWLVCIVALKRGKMRFFSNQMAVYRGHDESFWSSQTQIRQFEIRFSAALSVSKLLDDRYKLSIINYNIRKMLAAIREGILEEHQMERALQIITSNDPLWIRKKVLSFLFLFPRILKSEMSKVFLMFYTYKSV